MTAPEKDPVPDPTPALVTAAASGCHDAITRLFETFSPVLLASAQARLARTHAPLVSAEDVVLDTWCEALPRLASVDWPQERSPAECFIGWLQSFQLNRVRTLKRAWVLRRTSELQEDLPDDGSTRPDGLSRDLAGAATQVMRGEEAERLAGAIAALEPQAALVLQLRGLDQLPIQEVAERLGVSQVAARKRYSRALAALRSAIPGSVFEHFADG